MFDTAAAELEDASSVTGCIVLAAAAGPNFVAAADAMAAAGNLITIRSQEIQAMPTDAGADAAEGLQQAGSALDVASRLLERAGESLECGQLGG